MSDFQKEITWTWEKKLTTLISEKFVRSQEAVTWAVGLIDREGKQDIMKISQLRVNNIEHPLGFHVEPLSFSWKVERSGEEKKMQSARIRIFCDGEQIYDSGEDTKACSTDYPVALELKPRTRYTWSVEVKADNGEIAKADSYFETGKRNEKWVGEWIAPQAEDKNIHPVMRRNFYINPDEAGKSARLYICGLGIYETYINGKKVGNEYLAPGYHSYDFHLQAQTYDATEYLQAGENEIQIWLGAGWFKGRLGFEGGYTDLYGDSCYVISELYVGAETQPAVFTGKGWKYHRSPILNSNIYDGEVYDSRIAETLQENGWKDAVLRAPEKCGSLCDRYSLPIIKHEEFKAELLRTPKHEYVLDFGQNLTGWVEFDTELPKGMTVTLTASEIMQDGCFYRENLRTAKAEFTYITNGTREHARPHFTFYGFRYMKVEIRDPQNGKDVTGEWIFGISFTAYHLRSDFEQIGEIKTGKSKVDQLFSNALWGQKDNFLDVPTDCPQRDERLGWTGDAQVFAETACYNMYMPAFYRKYLWDMRAEQSILNGAVPNVVPRLKKGMVAEYGSCPWADAGVIIPWKVYQQYGNRTLLAECYPGMKAWVDYQRKKEETLGGLHLIKDGFHFADWLALDNPQPGPFGATDPLYVASAYYYEDTRITAKSAEILEKTEEAAEYQKLADEILKAIRQTYFDENGLCTCKTQTGSAIAIMFGLNPSEKTRQQEGDMLAQRVEENNGHLNTGFVGTTMLCPALTGTGHHDIAVQLLLNEDYPGWLYSVNLGATTIWERWDSVLKDGHLNAEGMNSLNHYSYGSIEAWMYGEVCGIRASDAGFKKAVIAPHADRRLGYAKCTLDTAAGCYRSSWHYEKDTVVYEIEVPFDAQAEFRAEGVEPQKLEAGTYIFNQIK